MFIDEWIHVYVCEVYGCWSQHADKYVYPSICASEKEGILYMWRYECVERNLYVKMGDLGHVYVEDVSESSECVEDTCVLWMDMPLCLWGWSQLCSPAQSDWAWACDLTGISCLWERSGWMWMCVPASVNVGEWCVCTCGLGVTCTSLFVPVCVLPYNCAYQLIYYRCVEHPRSPWPTRAQSRTPGSHTQKLLLFLIGSFNFLSFPLVSQILSPWNVLNLTALREARGGHTVMSQLKPHMRTLLCVLKCLHRSLAQGARINLPEDPGA